MKLTKKIAGALAGLALLGGSVEAKDSKKEELSNELSQYVEKMRNAKPLSDFVSRVYVFTPGKPIIGDIGAEVAQGKLVDSNKKNLKFTNMLEKNDHVYTISCKDNYLVAVGIKTTPCISIYADLYGINKNACRKKSPYYSFWDKTLSFFLADDEEPYRESLDSTRIENARWRSHGEDIFLELQDLITGKPYLLDLAHICPKDSKDYIRFNDSFFKQALCDEQGDLVQSSKIYDYSRLHEWSILIRQKKGGGIFRNEVKISCEDYS